MRTLELLTCFLFATGCGGDSTSRDAPAAGMANDGDGARPDGESSGGEDEGQSLGLLNEGHLESGLTVGGMPDRAVLEAARDQGITQVISLRTMAEPGAADERALVEELGMTFVSIPVAGAEGVTEENARAVHEAIGDDAETTLLHCGTSNRVGAMLALRAFLIQDATKEDALSLGREAGMTGTEDAARAVIDAHCEADPDRC